MRKTFCDHIFQMRLKMRKLTTTINSSNDNKRVEVDELSTLYRFIKESNHMLVYLTKQIDFCKNVNQKMMLQFINVVFQPITSLLRQKKESLKHLQLQQKWDQSLMMEIPSNHVMTFALLVEIMNLDFVVRLKMIACMILFIAHKCFYMVMKVMILLKNKG